MIGELELRQCHDRTDRREFFCKDCNTEFYSFGGQAFCNGKAIERCPFCYTGDKETGTMNKQTYEATITYEIIKMKGIGLSNAKIRSVCMEELASVRHTYSIHRALGAANGKGMGGCISVEEWLRQESKTETPLKVALKYLVHDWYQEHEDKVGLMDKVWDMVCANQINLLCPED